MITLYTVNGQIIGVQGEEEELDDFLRRVSLVGANLDGMNLSGIDLHGSNMSRASFVGTDLSDTNLRNAILTECIFSRTNVYECDMTAANLTGSSIYRTDMCEAILTHAWLDDTGLYWCEGCGDLVRGSSMCESCTDSEESDDIGTRSETSVVMRAARGYKGAYSRAVGVEWEINGTSREDMLQKWARAWKGGIHEDGSCGWEAVTPPVAGDAIKSCLEELGSVLSHATADEKCGIHVHVDASDMRWADVVRLLKVWAKVEPLMFLIGGQQRHLNTYCYPCGYDYEQAVKSDDVKGEILGVAFSESAWRCDATRARRRMRDKPHKKDCGRYKALNLIPWIARRGHSDCTIEFRLHCNSLNTERVVGWTHMLSELVTFACNAGDREVDALPRSALRTLLMACPSSRSWIMQRVLGWRRSVRPKARRVRVAGGRYALCAV